MDKKKTKIIISAFIAILILVTILAYKNRKIEIILTVDEEQEIIHTKKMNVGALLDSFDIFVDEETNLNYALDDELEEGMEIIVKNPKTYVIRMGDNMRTVRSFEKKVSDILGEIGFLMDEDDYTEPNLYSEVKENDIISVYKVAYHYEKLMNEVGFETLVKENANMNKGDSNIITHGVLGQKEETYQIRTVNGEEVERTLYSEDMVKIPTNKVVEVGTKEVRVASSRSSWIELDRRKKRAVEYEEVEEVASGSFDGNASKVIEMRATHYDNSPEQNGGWSTTAMGTPLRKGVVAVDPNVIPLGTRVYVESMDGSPDYGYARAEDTGSAIKGHKIDLCTGSESSRGKGIKQVRVYILE